MERSLFLSCQSYLYPISSSSLICGHGSSQNDSNSNCRNEVLLDGMNLSIEPCENTNFLNEMNNSNNGAERLDVTMDKLEEQLIQPAYFLSQKPTASNASTDRNMQLRDEAKNRDNNNEDTSAYLNEKDDNDFVKKKDGGSILADPTFCKVQLVLHTSRLPVKGMTTPVKKANRRDLSEIHDQVMKNDEAILIANIDGNHFQIDINRICSIRVGWSEDKHSLAWRDGFKRKSNTNSTKQISSFLILEMPSCCFRIFISKPLTNGNSVFGTAKSSLGIDDDRANFDAIRTRLEKLLSGDSILPFPMSYSGLVTPLRQALEPNSNHKVSGKENGGNSTAPFRRCLHSYSQSWNDLIMFECMLDNPHPAAPIGSTRTQSFKDTVNKLMSRIPNQVSSSFVEEDDLTKAVELYEKKIATKIEDFEDVIENFWNEKSEHKRNNKRRRDDTEDESCQNDCVRRFVDILKDHKEYVISKHELFLLPLRG